MNGQQPRTVLVTGATGTVGRHLVTALLDADVRVRALVRHPGTARFPAAVEVVRGDLLVPDDVARAAAGANAAFLLWPGLDGTGADAVAGALAARVDRVVYLSAAELQDDRVGPKDGAWADVEAALRATGVGATFLRAGGFAANTLGWAPAIRAGEPVALPFPEAVRSPVHERDIADVAAAALQDPRHAGTAYEITGPEQLTMRRQAEIVAPGGIVRHQARAEAEAEMATIMGREYASAALAYWATLEASPERVSDDVERVLGRPARTYAAWTRDHADDFRLAHAK
ncbi:nucleotide-diphosphate-sugar epimerase [Actinomycetospora sp. NBRC 106375]|uniref:SDR family oxidoreductase n=1 Tax=Actinomycetospora sp. NBRC 106375 TaxID=3032207 RepID=UPI0024A5E91A|nr:NAD(P)H-binding protein [Actinomycetospora sp. NBRC 106375]GLZ48107.1 nucleotide-diphosphate-sugar epimerase [Actinomycetospora sp. NBRC 106375]